MALGDFDPFLLDADDALPLLALLGERQRVGAPVLDLLQQTILFEFVDSCLDVTIVAGISCRDAEKFSHVLQCSAIGQVVVRQHSNQRQDLEFVLLPDEPVILKFGFFIHLYFHLRSPSDICG